MNYLVNMKENVNKITDRKINKNSKSDNNTSLQNQQKFSNCDLCHEKHDCEDCNYEFYKSRNI